MTTEQIQSIKDYYNSLPNDNLLTLLDEFDHTIEETNESNIEYGIIVNELVNRGIF